MRTPQLYRVLTSKLAVISFLHPLFWGGLSCFQAKDCRRVPLTPPIPALKLHFFLFHLGCRFSQPQLYTCRRINFFSKANTSNPHSNSVSRQFVTCVGTCVMHDCQSRCFPRGRARDDYHDWQVTQSRRTCRFTSFLVLQDLRWTPNRYGPSCQEMDE